MQPDNSFGQRSDESPLSLSRLRQAFAAMLGERDDDRKANSRRSVSRKLGDDSLREIVPRAVEVNPRSVVEAILFVGRPDNGAMSARELAAAMRGVSPDEVDAAVRQLNAVYNTEDAPYHVEVSSGGYRLALRDEFGRLRVKFYGRVREARLSPAAIEVLSIVAYRQPITLEEINELRGAATGTVLSTLVRRGLVRLERSDGGSPVRYTTTERFLRLFGLDSLGALPHSAELEKA